MIEPYMSEPATCEPGTKLCRDCRFYSFERPRWFSPFSGHWCDRRISPTTGEVVQRDCEAERRYTNDCGPAAQHWEPRR